MPQTFCRHAGQRGRHLGKQVGKPAGFIEFGGRLSSSMWFSADINLPAPAFVTRPSDLAINDSDAPPGIDVRLRFSKKCVGKPNEAAGLAIDRIISNGQPHSPSRLENRRSAGSGNTCSRGSLSAAINCAIWRLLRSCHANIKGAAIGVSCGRSCAVKVRFASQINSDLGRLRHDPHQADVRAEWRILEGPGCLSVAEKRVIGLGAGWADCALDAG